MTEILEELVFIAVILDGPSVGARIDITIYFKQRNNIFIGGTRQTEEECAYISYQFEEILKHKIVKKEKTLTIDNKT